MGDKKLNQLHICLLDKTVGEFDSEANFLSLSKAKSVRVGIKEYEEELKQIEEKFEAKKNKVREDNKEAIKRIEKEQKHSEDFINKNYEGYLSGDVTAETYGANYAARKEGIDKRADEIKGINDKLDLKETEKVGEIKALNAKYSNVRWVSTLVRGSAMNLDSESFNEAWKSGEVRGYSSFKDFLIGGGFVYLEPFFQGDTPQGKSPYGLLVSAKGTPAILGADWRDGDGNKISEDIKVAFGSTVYLNIYTQALYGQEIEIALKDKGNWLSRTFNMNKKLTANQRAEGAGDAEEFEIQAEKFTRGVDVHKVPKAPSTAIIGTLIEGGENIYDKKWIDSERVQMCQFAVNIDHDWRYTAGDDLGIYPTVFYGGLEQEFLDCKLMVHQRASHFYEVEKIESNQVAVYSEVETNIVHFKPCGYTKITSAYGLDGEEVTVFEQRAGAISKELKLQFIASDVKKEWTLDLENLNTDECRYIGTANDHNEKVISLSPGTSLDELGVWSDNLTQSISYPKPSLAQAIEMAWLPNIEPLKYGVDFASCRFQQHLDVEVYPDLEYTFNIHLGVDEDEYLYVKQTKDYDKRKYGAKKSDGSKAVKKAHNKERVKAYKEDIDNKVTGSNFTKKYELSLGMEYSFGGGEPAKVELEGIATLKSIIETTLYIVDVIDSYLCGSKMKEAEDGAQFDDNGNKKEISPSQQKKNKKDFEEKKGKRKKKKKEFGKLDLPLRFEVSPPKFTGGVTWSYANSSKHPELVGVNYQFKFGALPLIGFTGALDLLFCAQYIPYIGKAVKALDNAVAAINRAGSVLETLGIGSMEAEYYFDLVVSTELNINLTEGATYHTIDGFTAGNVQIDSPIEIKLEAGGNVRYKVFDIKGEAGIHAEATAKFNISYLAKNKKFLTFEFEGIEAIVTAKFKVEVEDKNNSDDEPEQPEKDPDPVPILNGFSIDIPLFG